MASGIISTFVSVALLTGVTAWAESREIAFDNGRADYSTVIGYWKNNGSYYYQRMGITLPRTEGVSNTRVALHVHVGSEIMPVQGKNELLVGIRVNGGGWHWQPLDGLRDNRNHWIEFPIPDGELKKGLNTVETNSTVASEGNMTSRSVDILGSAASSPAARSWYTFDFRSYNPLPDRNWGVRIRYDATDDPGLVCSVASLSISPGQASTVVGEPVQFLIEARDASGATVPQDTVEWSATSGTIDRYGLFKPTTNGVAVIGASVNGHAATAVCDARLEPPAGVLPADSPHRLGSNVAPGNVDIGGAWEFRLDPSGVGEIERYFAGECDGNWGQIHVPGSWQAQGWGLDYHGVGWYRRSFDVPVEWAGKRIWMDFDGVATSARVWVNGQYAGEHIGNWSPFSLEVTDLVEQGANEVAVRVAEMPGHFSAGFPCVVAPHFGGIWQPVSLRATGGVRVSDVWVLPRLATSDAKIEVELNTGAADSGELVCTVIGPDGSLVNERSSEFSGPGGVTSVTLTVPVPNPDLWSQENPSLYRAVVEARVNGSVSDTRSVRFGMREVTRSGHRIYLNGKPLFVRGLLHWGVYPDHISIDPSEARIRQEFTDAMRAGFNLTKVCLFMMPKRYYEIADEMGMLIWQEYPVWQTFPDAHDPDPHYEFDREYAEWVRLDRNHASVVLRDLLCEGHNVNNNILGRIYSMVKDMTGGALLEDNSAYMNQVNTDWWDWHIYADLDQFHGIVDQLAFDLARKPEIKPYLTGEDLDCDTYRDMDAIRGRWVQDGKVPYWLTNTTVQCQVAAEEYLAGRYGPQIIPQIIDSQNRRAIALRKSYFESFRRHIEFSGYVMTAIRDNPLTRPGFYDDLDETKWAPEQWVPFNQDRVLILHSGRRSFCFESDEAVDVRLEFSNFGDSLSAEQLRWELADGSAVVASGESAISVQSGTVTLAASIHVDGLSDHVDAAPETWKLKASLRNGELAANQWNIRVFPAMAAPDAQDPFVYVYSPGGSPALAAALAGVRVSSLTSTGMGEVAWSQSGILVTDVIDDQVRRALNGGARVIYLPGDGDAIIPRVESPFWREMTIWLPTEHACLSGFPSEGFVDVQFHDMTTRKPFDLGAYRAEVTPVIWGLNGRFGNSKFLDYLFEAGVGSGGLIACCMNLTGEHNAAGRYLLDRLVRYVASGDFAPTNTAGTNALSELIL